MRTRPLPPCDCGSSHTHALLVNGQRVAMCVGAREAVKDWPPLTAAQEARIRALLDHGQDDERDG